MGSFNGLPARSRRRAVPVRAEPPARTKLIRAIHAACRAQGLDDQARRDLQLGVTNKASMGDMDTVDLSKVLDRLNGVGRGRANRAAADRPHVGKVRALWWSLYWLGEVHQTDARAIDAFVKRQTGIGALRFLDHRQAASVIEALKDWARRSGLDWPHPGDSRADRLAVFHEIRHRLTDPITALPAGAPERWTNAELDVAIRCVGRAWRKVLGR